VDGRFLLVRRNQLAEKWDQLLKFLGKDACLEQNFTAGRFLSRMQLAFSAGDLLCPPAGMFQIVIVPDEGDRLARNGQPLYDGCAEGGPVFFQWLDQQLAAGFEVLQNSLQLPIPTLASLRNAFYNVEITLVSVFLDRN
jgi:hypothetical protein